MMPLLALRTDKKSPFQGTLFTITVCLMTITLMNTLLYSAQNSDCPASSYKCFHGIKFVRTDKKSPFQGTLFTITVCLMTITLMNTLLYSAQNSDCPASSYKCFHGIKFVRLRAGDVKMELEVLGKMVI